MDLSISVVNHNTKNLIKQCLKNIIYSKLPLDYEIIVTDNGSKDGSVEFITKEILPYYNQVKLIKSINCGFGAGHNLGLKRSQAKYVIIINADIVILEDAIIKLYNFLEENKQIGIAAPKLIYPDFTIQPSCHPWPKFLTPLYRRTPLGKTPWGRQELRRYDMSDYDHQTPKEVDWLVGACLMIKKTVWDKIQGFDERYFLYCEDIDICRKCRQAGFEVWYYPPARMIHYHKRLSARKKWWMSLLNKNTRIHLKSHWLYFKKWHL